MSNIPASDRPGASRDEFLATASAVAAARSSTLAERRNLGDARASITEDDLPALVAERDSLRAMVNRCRREIRALRHDRDSQEDLVLELDKRDAELAAALSERDVLQQELELRIGQIAQLVRDHSRLVEEVRLRAQVLVELQELRARDQEHIAELRRERDDLCALLAGARRLDGPVATDANGERDPGADRSAGAGAASLTLVDVGQLSTVDDRTTGETFSRS